MRGQRPIASIVLAAGAGTRFGGRKQLAALGGRPLVDYAVEAASRVSADPPIVVLGAHAREIERDAPLDGARVVRCEDWAEGRGASLRVGLMAVPGDRAAAVVFLADEPFVPEGAAERLLAAREPRLSALRASYHGRPGHPVLIERPLFAALTAAGPPPNPRRVLETAKVRSIECGDLGDPGDVDTLDQLLELRARHAGTAGAGDA